ncbi:DUF2799 domain-containing protein [Vibrio sp. S9_S30]|uniref:DUF2799 domain-containing protein n=1 Tax=Vibrio sp. S9_S30 TaxID=2720226 RepID=UPI001680C548|nr:DUF2799 domain-containing protein [Vibrio sp. S9_S30]MBD1557665.1 DUF2799 domain-containing protein [Vibrio sp. S9_S30]
MRKNLVLSLFVIGALSGCSSISEEECLLGDWYQLGLRDGQKGKSNQAADYNKDCSEYSVQLDLERYNQGRNEGLKSYCTYENGVALGLANQDYYNVCPTELSSQFLFGYTPYNNLAKAQSKQQQYQRLIYDYSARLKDANISDSDRVTYQSELSKTRDNLEYAKYDTKKYEIELELHKIEKEKQEIVKELSKSDVSATQKEDLNKRLNALNKQQNVYETLRKVGRGATTIKSIVDLF